MTTLLFIRHGAHDLLSHILTGRTHPVHLNALGQRQAQWLSQRVATFPIDALLSSPLDRCIETATPISERLGVPVERAEALNEVEFGEWNGREFQKLAPLPEWKNFNLLRSLNPPPGGENLADIQARVLSLFSELQQRFPNGCVALVSHADVIKAALAWLLGVPADLFNRIEISPGSLSHAVLHYGAAPRIISINESYQAA